MDHAVHLEGSRCDGALHGGCQADCQFFWKLDWLKPVNERSENAPAPRNTNCTEQTLLRATRAPGSDTDEQPVWVCQATALFEATSPLKWWDVRQYVRDVTSRNHSASHIFKVLLAAAYRKFVAIGPGYAIKVALYNRFQRLRGGMPFAAVSGQIPPGTSTPTGFLDLKPGEWVRVKSREEIATTITTDGFNRGMRHDNEMLRYSGGEYRVQMRVERLINERTGKMMQMKTMHPVGRCLLPCGMQRKTAWLSPRSQLILARDLAGTNRTARQRQRRPFTKTLADLYFCRGPAPAQTGQPGRDSLSLLWLQYQQPRACSSERQ
jgi:hypothetical protein